MDDFMKMAFEMVKAQAGVRAMTADEMMSMALELSKKLAAISCEPVAQAEAALPVVDGKKSIKEKSVTCCECGKVMKLITAKHLAVHGLTKAEYLAKYGMKKGTSLMAKGLARARKEKMLSMELWKRREPKVAGEAKTAATPKKKAAAVKKPKAVPKEKTV